MDVFELVGVMLFFAGFTLGLLLTSKRALESLRIFGSLAGASILLMAAYSWVSQPTHTELAMTYGLPVLRNVWVPVPALLASLTGWLCKKGHVGRALASIAIAFAFAGSCLVGMYTPSS